ncbi:hypothetical protein B0H14DRAFT_2585045 [Mycena olivaceomarginata]|nr:hypothetical protein B0H14DRAFT_2585045 [Mycena olivaceomarginata]
MPPKGTSKLRNEAEELWSWILVKNSLCHLMKPPHLQAVRLAKERERKMIRLEEERAAASATNRLCEIQFVAPSFPGPVGATSSAQVSDAEREMWDNYRMNGAEFSAGDNVEKPEMEDGRAAVAGGSRDLWLVESGDDGQHVGLWVGERRRWTGEGG